MPTQEVRGSGRIYPLSFIPTLNRTLTRSCLRQRERSLQGGPCCPQRGLTPVGTPASTFQATAQVAGRRPGDCILGVLGKTNAFAGVSFGPSWRSVGPSLVEGRPLFRYADKRRPYTFPGMPRLHYRRASQIECIHHPLRWRKRSHGEVYTENTSCCPASSFLPRRRCTNFS